MVPRVARAVALATVLIVGFGPSSVLGGPADDAFLTAIPANDAGSGHDAGNARAVAHEIASFGKYPGRLEQPEDVDWYGKRPSSVFDVPICLSATVNAKTFADLSLVATTGPYTREVLVHGTPGKTAKAGLAFPAATEALVGVEPSPPTAQAPPRPYDFSLAALFAQDIVSDTGASGGDAPNTPDNANLVSAGCVAGILRGEEGDTADVFAFAGKPGDVVTLSLRDLAGGTTRATLISPDKVPMASVDADAAPSVTELTSPGVWYVSVTTSSASTTGYALGLALDPKPPPCSPGC
ncbi:MAG TPA: hypothetical protein VI997_05870 [Candidatus Thermoplasmatota archaeon]|nr:hypothetical protein [Candidatus Thermoplasmatota archaeon]